jgi:Holliday junction DNA helicase RuvA
MIARIHGRVAAVEDDALVVEVGGVGLRVHVPAPLLADLGPEGSTVTLHTHLHVRETELALYGAADAASLRLFRLLLGVGGIGPRLALAVLSAFDVGTVERAILESDTDLLSQVSGVGRKTAHRIVLDLKGRLESEGLSAGGAGLAGPAVVDEEAVAALLTLGYNSGEARRALARAADEVPPDAPVEERIRAALRLLAPG